MQAQNRPAQGDEGDPLPSDVGRGKADDASGHSATYRRAFGAAAAAGGATANHQHGHTAATVQVIGNCMECRA